MAVISKGINLYYGEVGADKPQTLLTNLMEIPELGGDAEAIEITTLADEAHMYTDGIKNYGDSITFKFLYENAQFNLLNADSGKEKKWQVVLPDLMACTFTGTYSVKLDGVGVNAALTYTLSVKPTSAMVWTDQT
jgi:hypothetical protein